MMARLSYIYLFSLFLIACCTSLQSDQPKPKVKAIVFDFGGVITKKNVTVIAEFISKSLNISQPEALQTLAKLKQFEHKGGKEIDFWPKFGNSIGKKITADWLNQLKEARLQAIEEIPGMNNLVKDLQKQGYKTALLSNGKRLAGIKKERGYYDLFHPIILSSEVGIRKPDPKVYRLILNQLNMKPEEVLFIDNKIENVKGAQSVGMDAIEFVSMKQLTQELKQRGIVIKSADSPK